eukprot:CAMPEP_0180641432 /NCGR_PEP_ID=MMETSP1037_2-20121125/46492_1 /TAXON_ID=632150 /ORGANISM="Azadinium spinosum, Strain 3D9" /LENGTH=35 /DNA_ID= /DNA_START= /DNA_END= /DNA_ORIENTATION=
MFASLAAYQQDLATRQRNANAAGVVPPRRRASAPP